MLVNARIFFCINCTVELFWKEFWAPASLHFYRVRTIPQVKSVQGVNSVLIR